MQRCPDRSIGSKTHPLQRRRGVGMEASACLAAVVQIGLFGLCLQALGCDQAAASGSCPLPQAFTPADADVSSAQLLSVWSSGTGDVVAVGSTPSGGVLLVSQDDGCHFTRREVKPPLAGVWGDGSGLVIAVGPGGDVVRSSDHGASWSTSKVADASLTAVSGDGHGKVVAVGQSCSLCTVAFIAASVDSGMTWTVARPQSTNHLLGLDAATFVDGAFLVGGFSVPQEIDPIADALLERSTDAVAWNRVLSDRNNLGGPFGCLSLRGLWGASASDLYGVGGCGLVLHSSDGIAWIRAASPAKDTSIDFNAIWGSGSDDVWLAGSQGALLRSTDAGARWGAQALPSTADLYGVAGSRGGSVFAVGRETLLRGR